MSDTIKITETENFEALPRSILAMGSADAAMFVHFRLGLCSLTKNREESVAFFRDDPALMEEFQGSIVTAADALCRAAELMAVAHQRMELIAEDVRRLRAN
jgi:hypothetical protein